MPQSTRQKAVADGLNQISKILQNGQQLNGSQTAKLSNLLKKASDAVQFGFDVESCKSNLRAQGVSETQANTVCNDEFGGNSVSVTTPKMARKQASIPDHVLTYDYTHNELQPERPIASNIKSASLPDHIITQLNSPTHRNKLYESRKEKSRQLKSASTDSDNRPYHTYWKYSS
jgi:hypothetical protein